MTLLPEELEQLSGLIEELSVDEVEEIYLPLSRLLNLYVAAAQKLHTVSSRFLGRARQQGAFHHRRRRLGGRGQEHHGARSEGAAGALAAIIRASS